MDEETHYRLLKLIDANPRMSQRELAGELGVSLGKVNYCLKALMEKGWVKVQNFRNSQHKWAYAYLLTPSGLKEKAGITVRFLKRKLTEYEALKDEIEALEQEVHAANGTTERFTD